MSGSTQGTSIVLDAVVREFDDNTGLHSSSLTISPGEFVSVLGPSGCGKSTMLRCIAGLETPDSGVITFGDTTVFDSAKGINVPPNRRGLSMVFQDLALWPHMTVEGNVEFPLTVGKTNLTKEQRHKRVASALDRVGITDKAKRRPHELSGGQQQRVAIARAIVSNPDVVLMDEPLSALDAALRIQIRGEITALARDLGVTVVYVTHDQAEALAMSDRVIVMNAGDIRQFASPVDIYNNPADDFVAGFVGHMNFGPQGQAWRPEHVRIADQDTPLVPGTGRFTGVVENSQYVGGHYEVRLHIDRQPSQWLVYSAQPILAGEEVTLHAGIPTE